MTVRRQRVKPQNRFFRNIHNALYPLIESEFSNMLVAKFQRLCGLGVDGKVSNLFLNYLFRLASTTGEEIFGLMPLLCWLTFPLFLSFATNFVIILMIGQLLKDFIMLPRPISNDPKWKIFKVDEHFETEFGMPSTHTMTGYLPMTTVMELMRQGTVIPFSAWTFVVFYVIVVALSRLYLGVHSTYDIAAGGILGLVIIQFVHLYGDIVANVVYMGKHGIYITLLLTLAFATIYPKPAKGWAASYGTSAQIFGSWAGISSSLWYIFNIHTSLRDVLIYTSFVPWFGDIFTVDANGIPFLATTLASTTQYSPSMALTLRMLVACIIAAVVKVVSKAIAVPIFVFLLKAGITKVEKEEEGDVFGRMVDINKAYWVEVPVRLISYGSLAWSVVVLTPLMWQYLHLV